MEAMKSKYETMLSEFKAKTSQLEKEKEQLTSNLMDAKSKANASKYVYITISSIWLAMKNNGCFLILS